MTSYSQGDFTLQLERTDPKRPAFMTPFRFEKQRLRVSVQAGVHVASSMLRDDAEYGWLPGLEELHDAGVQLPISAFVSFEVCIQRTDTDLYKPPYVTTDELDVKLPSGAEYTDGMVWPFVDKGDVQWLLDTLLARES